MIKNTLTVDFLAIMSILLNFSVTVCAALELAAALGGVGGNQSLIQTLLKGSEAKAVSAKIQSHPLYTNIRYHEKKLIIRTISMEQILSSR